MEPISQRQASALLGTPVQLASAHTAMPSAYWSANVAPATYTSALNVGNSA